MINVLIYIVCFLIFIVLQGLFINGVRDLFNEGMVLYKLRLFIDSHVNEFWRKPLYSCVKCMASFWGAITFFPFAIYLFGFRWEEILVYGFDAIILVYVNYFFYKNQ